jgi:integrase
MAHKRGKRWVATGYDKSVKRKRHLGTFDTKKEATNAEADWRLRTHPTGDETCDQFADRWMRDYPRPSASTRRTHRERTRRFAKDFEGVKLPDVDKRRARTWARGHPNDAPVVATMFADAMRDGLVDRNPFAQLRLPRSRGRKDIIALTETEVIALADLALDPRMELKEFGPEYRAMVLWAGFVGTRPGETFALRRDDIGGEHVTISRSYSSHTHEIGPPKNGRERVVTIAPVVSQALEDAPAHPSGLLFETPTGCQWTASLHHRYWVKMRLLANRPRMAFYELRHACATMLLERGVTPWDVAIQLGHTDGGQLVMERYGHPSEAGARARLLQAWDVEIKPLRAVSGASRAQRS